MRAEQIRYHFGRNFLPLRGMCCFNLIRYGTYQGDESTPGIGDVLPDTRAPLCPPPPPPFHSNPPSGCYWLRFVTTPGKAGYSFTVNVLLSLLEQGHRQLL